ncbi:MAG: flippase-like domain-containing protein, partial [candidate division Zixibacteria bacterium]|nr:flippase-like domain-containing protein [candidate division Zixibacteria bacterium]
IMALFWLVKIWGRMLRHTGSSVSYLKLFKVWFFSNLGRYLPGKVWQFLGMIYMLEKRGVPKKNSFSTAVVAQFFSVISGLLIAALFLGADLYSQFLSKSPGLIVVIAMFFLAVIVMACYPKLLQKIVNFGLGILKKEKISLDITGKDVIIYLLCYSVSWLLFGLAFLVFIKAMAQASFAMYPSLTGAFAFSVNIGFLALFVPGGIGVREGLLVLLLSSLFPAFFPVPVATLISLLARLWVTVAELLCFLIAVPLK